MHRRQGQPDDGAPAVGLVGRLVGDAASWSGIPSHLERALTAHGLATFTISAEPSAVMQRRARRYLRQPRRHDPSWAQTPEMMLLRNVVVRARRHRHQPTGPVCWVQMGSEFGAPLGKRFVTLEDMTVASALRIPDLLGGPVRPSVALAWKRQQQRVYRRAKICCVASRWQAASLVLDYDVPLRRIRVVGFGQSLVQSASEREWTSPRFLFVGLGWERKNGARVLEAFQRVRASWPEATLDVVGDHPQLDVPGVTGHGRLDHSRAEDRSHAVSLLRQATCFVLPSLYEPFGIAYVEAGAAGIGSIATTVGGALDAVGEQGGLFVDPFDVVGIYEAMLQFCEEGFARAAGEAAARHASLLTWDRVSGRVATALGLDLVRGPEPPLVTLSRDEVMRFVE